MKELRTLLFNKTYYSLPAYYFMFITNHRLTGYFMNYIPLGLEDKLPHNQIL